MRYRLLATALLLLLAGPLAAGDWVYPMADFRDAAGRTVYPTSDGRRFMTAMEREAYLRQSRDLLLGPRAAEAAARRARDAVAAAAPFRPARPLFPPALDGQAAGEAAGEDVARQVARQAAEAHERNRGLGRRLGRAGGDAATIRAEIATARARQALLTAEGEERLRSNAAAARATLGETETRPRGPLIRIPRVVLE